MIEDGFYQLLLDGRDFIFRIKTHDADDRAYPGKQVLAKARKYGSRTYNNFGWIDDGLLHRNGLRWRDPEYDADVIKVANLLLSGDTAVQEQAGQLYSRSFGRCYVCNRNLTHPDSRATGIGPECSGLRKHREIGLDESSSTSVDDSHLDRGRVVKHMQMKVLQVDDDNYHNSLQLIPRGPVTVISHKAGGWPLEPNEYRYPGQKLCLGPLEMHLAEKHCTNPVVWRTVGRDRRIFGNMVHIGYYCDEHLPASLRTALSQGDFLHYDSQSGEIV